MTEMHAETLQNQLPFLLKESVVRQQDDADNDDSLTELTENEMKAPFLKKKLIRFVDCRRLYKMEGKIFTSAHVPPIDRFLITFCHDLQDMDAFIKDSFQPLEILGTAVAKGHYDLVWSTGEVILPGFWEELVEEDLTFPMHMWPSDATA
jgi:hypothetical protein